MSNKSLLIDNAAFAKRNEHLAGSLSLSECPRLAELLSSQTSYASLKESNKHARVVDDSIKFTLDGRVGATGQLFLQLALKASLITHCQRCLEEMPLALNLNFNYLLTDAALDELDSIEAEVGDDYDLQEISKIMDLAALIEDEIIIAMPIAPTHDGSCTQNSMQSGEKPNPFAALKGLIKS